MIKVPSHVPVAANRLPPIRFPPIVLRCGVARWGYYDRCGIERFRRQFSVRGRAEVHGAEWAWSATNKALIHHGVVAESCGRIFIPNGSLMNANFEPQSSGRMQSELPSADGFEQWLMADPANYQYWAHLVNPKATSANSRPVESQVVIEQFLARRRATRNRGGVAANSPRSG